MSDFDMLLNPNLPQGTMPASMLNAITAPYPVELQKDYKYFFLARANASMHRKDGQRLAFMFKVLKTNNRYDIEYLQEEIARGHKELRVATPEEIEAYEMRMDPRGTIVKQLKNDPAFRDEYEKELRAELEAEIRAKLSTEDEGKVSGVDAAKGAGPQVDIGTGTLTPLQQLQAARLGGIVGSDKLAGAAAGSVGGATGGASTVAASGTK